MIPVQVPIRLASVALGLVLLTLGAGPARAQRPAAPAARALKGPQGARCTPDSPTGFSSKQTQMERVSDGQWRLSGLVEVECDRLKFFADSVDIFTDSHRLVAKGNVVFSSPLARIAAETADFNTETLTGTFTTASGIMTIGRKTDRALFAGQDPDVYFYAESLERVSERQYTLTNGAFTTCVQPTPRWEVVAGHATINVDESVSMTSTVLKVKGVPLLYIPYTYYPLKDGERATGFLMPTYGTSTVRGRAISNAFFLAMGRSQDATVFHDWFTKAGQGVGGEYRYLGPAGAEGSARTYLFSQHNATYHTSTGTTSLPATRSLDVTAHLNQPLGRHMRARSQVDYFSSLVTQQLYQQNVYAASRRQRQISGTWSGVWRQYSVTGAFQRSTLLDANGSSLTYGGAPRGSFAISPVRLLGLPVYGSVQTDFSHSVYQTKSSTGVVADQGLERFSAAPSVRVPISRWPFLTVNSSATWQNTLYSDSLDLQGRRSVDPISRRYFDLKADATGPTFTRIWDFGEDGDGGIQRLKHVVEPFSSLERITGTDNRGRIIQLYDARDYVVQDTTSLTYGLNNRLLVRPRARAGQTAPGSARELLTVSMQQTYYSNLLATPFDFTYVSSSRLTRISHYSPVALSVRAQPWNRVTTTSRLEFDPDNRSPLSTSLQASANPVPGLDVSGDYTRVYRQMQGPTGRITYDTVLRLSARVIRGPARASYSFTRDLTRAYNVQQSIGWTYNSQCCGVAIDYQAFNYPELSSLFPVRADRRVHFSVMLAGLGTFQNFFGAFGGTR